MQTSVILYGRLCYLREDGATKFPISIFGRQRDATGSLTTVERIGLQNWGVGGGVPAGWLCVRRGSMVTLNFIPYLNHWANTGFLGRVVRTLTLSLEHSYLYVRAWKRPSVKPGSLSVSDQVVNNRQSGLFIYQIFFAWNEGYILKSYKTKLKLSLFNESLHQTFFMKIWRETQAICNSGKPIFDILNNARYTHCSWH